MKATKTKNKTNKAKWKKLTPEILRTYGGKFAKMTNKQAKKYISKIEKYCLLACQQYLRLNRKDHDAQ